MATLSELLTRALQVYDEQVENMNSNVRIGSLLRDIVNFLDTKQDKDPGKGLSTNDFSNIDKSNLVTLIGLLNDNPDNVLNTISEVFKILESYPEGVKIVDLLSGKLEKGGFIGTADDLSEAKNLKKSDNDFSLSDPVGNIGFKVSNYGPEARVYNICDSNGYIIMTLNKDFFDSLFSPEDLVDNLTSDSTTTAVTAKQSKYLKYLVDGILSVLNFSESDTDFKVSDPSGHVAVKVDGDGLKAKAYNICDESGNVVMSLTKELMDGFINLSKLHELGVFGENELGSFRVGDINGNLAIIIDFEGFKTRKVVFCDQTGATITTLTPDIVASLNSILQKTDISTINIPYVFYVINPNAYSREYVVRVFPESFVDVLPQKPLLINGRRDYAISRVQKNTTSYEKITKPINLTGPGYNDKTQNLDVHCINESIMTGKNVRMLLFGVSYDDSNYLANDGTSIPGGSKAANLIEKLMFMGKVDTADQRSYTSVGTRTNGYDFTYKGQTSRMYGCSEARGGNTGINYLRQPLHFSPTDISYDPSVSGTSATGLIMWYMNGLRYRIPYNETYSESGTDNGVYERTASKTDALRFTPFGKYHHDYSSELWEFCKLKGWITAVGGTYTIWSNSTEQRNVTDLCMDYIANNPEYPWYSRDKARETSYVDGTAKNVTDNTQYAIDFPAYLLRYRTMDDLGVRLVNAATNPSGLTAVGSDGVTYTIGTRITTQVLLSSINVCLPTHVVWDMAYNDWGFYISSNGWSAATDSLALAQLFVLAVQEQLGGAIKIGLKAKRANGSFFPEMWGDIAVSQLYNLEGNPLNYNKLLIANYSNLAVNVNWIPSFAVSIPFTSYFLAEQEDFVYGKVLLASTGAVNVMADNIHDDIHSGKAMAHQIYGWILFTEK